MGPAHSWSWRSKSQLPRRHYEAAWNDSWHFRCCLHEHQTLIDAAKCAMPHGAGWYVISVESGGARELTEEEKRIVDEFRFGTHEATSQGRTQDALALKQQPLLGTSKIPARFTLSASEAGLLARMWYKIAKRKS